MTSNDEENPAQEQVQSASVAAQENIVSEENVVPKEEISVQSKGSGKNIIDPSDMDFLNEVQITISIEVGRAQIKIRDLLSLTKDSIIDLNKSSGEPVDIYANGKLISRGNIITSNGKYCVRLISVTEPVGSA